MQGFILFFPHCSRKRTKAVCGLTCHPGKIMLSSWNASQIISLEMGSWNHVWIRGTTDIICRDWDRSKLAFTYLHVVGMAHWMSANFMQDRSLKHPTVASAAHLAAVNFWYLGTRSPLWWSMKESIAKSAPGHSLCCVSPRCYSQRSPQWSTD